MNGRLAAMVVLSAALGAVFGAEAPPAPPAAPAAEDRPVAVAAVDPAGLTAAAAQRLGDEFTGADIRARGTGPADRAASAARWLGEVFAPATDPACLSVLAASGLSNARSGGEPARTLPPDRPVAAAPGAGEILVPQTLPPVTEDDVRHLRAFGLLPYEVALAGECARVVGARHAGPPPKDPVLRLTRAARLEGVARLAGLVLSTRAAGIEVADLGLAALSGDRDAVGLPRRSLQDAASDPVRRALLRTFFDDGLRWALFHYLKGGFREVLAALERPGASPASLLRPGRSHASPPLPAGACSLGPRGAAALLTGDDEAIWAPTVVADAWALDAQGRVKVQLWFDDEASATAAQGDLAKRGLSVERSEAALSALLRPARRPESKSP